MNYQKLFKEFILTGKTTASDRREFVKKHGVNDNTFRSKLTQWRKTASFDNWYAQQSTHRLIKKSINQSKADPKKIEQCNGETVDRNRDERGRFIIGNRASELHGKHKKAFRKNMFDSEEEEALSNCALMDSVRVMQNQLNILHEVSSRRLREIIAIYERGEKLIVKDKELTEFDAVQFVIEQTKNSSDPLLARITTTQKAVLEMDTIAAKRPSLAVSEQTELVIKLVKESEEKKLDSRSTCVLFLKHGLKPPSHLSKLAEIEAKNAEDEIDNDDGLSDNDAEEIRARSIERRALIEQRKEDIRKRNAKIYAEAQDLGREKITMSEPNDD